MTGSEPKKGAGPFGILPASPVAALVLGLFPSIAITTQVDYALAVGGGVLLVLVGSTLVARSISTVIPERFRFLAHLVIISALVTAVDEATRAYAPTLSKALGIYIPLIAVNCLILTRMTQGRSSVGRTAIESLAMGVAFAVSLALVALVREVLGSGAITLFPIRGWNGVVRVPGLSRHPIGVLALPAGAFFVVAYLAALAGWIALRRGGERRRRGRKTDESPRDSGKRAAARGVNAPETTA